MKSILIKRDKMEVCHDLESISIARSVSTRKDAVSHCKQGDQVGRIFVQSAIVFTFGSFPKMLVFLSRPFGLMVRGLS
jgi:hypothetical protein